MCGGVTVSREINDVYSVTKSRQESVCQPVKCRCTALINYSTSCST